MQRLTVGAYHFVPIPYEDSTSKPDGVNHDLLEALNQLQTQHHFNLFKAYPAGRYKACEGKHFDMMIFESKEWGWQDKPIKASKVFLKGAEIDISLKKTDRSQSYFNVIDDKSIIGIRDYHYGLANFNSDPG